MTERDFVVLGGGLAGLSAALNLRKKYPSASISIVEKDAACGGLAQSVYLDGVTFDLGPHVFRDRGRQWVSGLLGGIDFIDHVSKPAVYKYGELFDHVVPTITEANINSLPIAVKGQIRREMESGFGLAGEDFQSYLSSKIGKTLTWEFFGQYSKKWWGVEPSELSSSLAPKNISIGREAGYSHITTGFEQATNEYYPKDGGYWAIVKCLLDQATTSIDIMTGVGCNDLITSGGRVVGVGLTDGGRIDVGRGVFSTIPITELAGFFGIKTSLTYRADVFVLVAFPREYSTPMTQSWVYFPEDKPIFSRLCSPGVFSPNNETSRTRGYCAEITCGAGDETYSTDDEALLDCTLSGLFDVGVINRNTLVKFKVIRAPHAYPVLTINSHKQRDMVFDEIGVVAENLYPIGRTGAFNYWNGDSVLGLVNV